MPPLSKSGKVVARGDTRSYLTCVSPIKDRLLGLSTGKPSFIEMRIV